MKLKASSPKFSAFVSASAGTGKTKILIDRLINLLLTNCKPSKILCLAFTKAAANEILVRINQRLSNFAICNEDVLIKELEHLGFKNPLELTHKARTLFTELLDEIEPLNIQTIHAFCQQLLLKFPFESEVNLNFSLLNESKVTSFIEQAKNIFLNNIDNYPKAEEAITYLSWHIKEYSFKELLEEIIENREALDDFFNIHNTLDNALKTIDPNIIDENLIINEFIKNIPIKTNNIEILYLGGKTDKFRASNLEKFLKFSNNIKLLSLNDYLNCFLTLTGDRAKSILSKKLYETYPELAQLLEEEQERVFKFSKFLKHLKAINLTKAFIVLSYYIREIYKQIKTQNNSIDYDDLISLTLNLLNNSEHAEWVNYKLNGGIEHILIDEAQDDSAKQWQIINKISEDFFFDSELKKSIFIVGDAKQSIFSFQGANPQLFNQMNHNLPNEVVRLQLNESYRSGKNILQLIDSIFNQSHILPLVTEIEKNIEHKVYKTSNSSVELLPLVIDEEKEEKKEWLLPSEYSKDNQKTGSELLAKLIAQRIKEDLETKEIKDPGDILILTRRRTIFITHLIKELRALHIPTSGLDRLKLSEHPITLDLIALTNFMLCSADDLNLAIILKSPICNLTEEALLELCITRETTLWDNLKANTFYLSTLELLTKLQNLAKEKSPFEFYFYAFEYLDLRTSFKKHFALEADDILDAFLDLLSEYQNENILSLQLFLNFLNTNKTEVKRDFSRSKNQVKIMTIHNAKGLQAKTVFLTDTTSLPSNKDSIIWLDEQKLLWPGKEKYYPDIAKEIKVKKQDKEYAEYLRLLYVALTRAEDKLIICGTAKNENISDKSWYSIIKNCI